MEECLTNYIFTVQIKHVQSLKAPDHHILKFMSIQFEVQPSNSNQANDSKIYTPTGSCSKAHNRGTFHRIVNTDPRVAIDDGNAVSNSGLPNAPESDCKDAHFSIIIIIIIIILQTRIPPVKFLIIKLHLSF